MSSLKERGRETGEERKRKTDSWSDGSHDDLIERMLLVLVGELEQQTIERFQESVQRRFVR